MSKDIENAIEELEKLSRYAKLLNNPDEFFHHMQGHRTELSLVLSAFGIADMSKTIIEVLKKQLNGGWIPVSERLPENQPSWIRVTTYIITLKNKNNNIRTSFAKYKERKWIGDFGRIISDNDVLAWRKKPEPYKEGEN